MDIGQGPMGIVGSLPHAVLKRLYNAGSHGMLQKHLFARLPPSRHGTLIATMKAMESAGLVERSNTARHTAAWAILWTLTPAGKTQYAAQPAPRRTDAGQLVAAG